MCILRKNIMDSDASSAKLQEAESTADVSQESSPRSVGGTGSDDHICLKADDLRPGRVKVLCSYGGKICPRPLDNQLHYAGGDRKIMSVSRNVSFLELTEKLAKLTRMSKIVIKYQLPFEDLDALVSVLSDEDVRNMLEEHEKAESRNSLCRLLRLFIFENKRQEDVKEHHNGLKLSEHQFSDNINMTAINSKKQHTSVTPAEPLDYLFGLNDGADFTSIHAQPFTQGLHVKIESPVTKLSSFLDPPSPISVSDYTLAEKAASQFYKPPVECMHHCYKDSREHLCAFCCRPPAGGDAGSMSRKHAVDLDSESSLKITRGCVSQMHPPDAFRASIPSDFICPKRYFGLHQEIKVHDPDVLQKTNMFRDRNDIIHDKVDFLIPNEDLRHDTVSSHSHQILISEKALGFSSHPTESGDLASSSCHHLRHQHHLHPDSPHNTSHKTCLRKFHHQPHTEHNECTSHESIKISSANSRLPSKQTTYQKGNFGEVLSPRQVNYPQYYFQRSLPETTSKGKLSRTSCLSQVQVAHQQSDHAGPCSPARLQPSSPTNHRDHHLHDQKIIPHQDPSIDTRARMAKSACMTKPYTEHYFQGHNFPYPHEITKEKLYNVFDYNPDVHRQCKVIEGIVETNIHGSTKKLEAGL